MSLSGREFYIKNKELQRYFDQLTRDLHTEIPTNLARDLGRMRIVRDNRKHIWIGEDQKNRTSIIKLRPPLRMKKEGNKYFLL